MSEAQRSARIVAYSLLASALWFMVLAAISGNMTLAAIASIFVVGYAVVSVMRDLNSDNMPSR